MILSNVIIKLRNKNFIIMSICLFLYSLNQLFFKNIDINLLNEFFNSYFNDLLSTPLYFSYLNFLLSFVKKEIIGLKNLLIITVICSFLAEYLAIFIRPNSVSDPLDVLCYFIGTFIYWGIIKFLKE